MVGTMAPLLLLLVLEAAASYDTTKLNYCGFPKYQQWQVNPDGVHNEIVRVSDSGCLDVWKASSDNGAEVDVYPCHPADSPDNQSWLVKGDGTIVEEITGKCLDRSNYGTSPGTQVWLWDCTGAFNQQWTVNATDLTIRATDSGLCLDAGGPLPRTCDMLPARELPFCNYSLSYEARVKDVIGRLTDSEKEAMLVNSAAGVNRLNLYDYQWWSEALHGVASSPGVNFGGEVPCATSFPQVCTSGASFNRTLWNLIGDIVSTEARAMNNVNRAGLTYWAPNVNIFRDPRWGRGQETPGEDPYLTSQYVYYFVSGMQDSALDPEHVKDWGGVDRYHFDAIVTDQDMADTFMPPFQMCTARARGTSLMCSYNAINGIPACADTLIMTTIARETWGFEGYITSDCGAVDNVQNAHHYTDNSDDTCKVTLEAGMDIECGSFFTDNLADAVNDGAVSEDDLNRALYNLFMTQFRLGMFDPRSVNPLLNIPPSAINTSFAQMAALEAAQQGIVLLQNSQGALPLDRKNIATVAMVGPSADASRTMQGNYYGSPPYLISPDEGMQNYGMITTLAKGCSDIACEDTSDFSEAIQAAGSCDATVIVAGLDQGQESEGRDRTTLTLPGNQDDLISQVADAAKGPVILVMMNGGPIDISVHKNNPQIDAIIWVGYPGQSGGQAIADVIFGTISPSGRLPYTIYPAIYADQVPMTDMNMRPTPVYPGRTYRFYNGSLGPAIFEFGTGLSYTIFNYTFVNQPQGVFSETVTKHLKLKQGSAVQEDYEPLEEWNVRVTNVGTVPGSDVVLAFMSPPGGGQNGVPIKYLFGFEKVFLQPGEDTIVHFPITALDLSVSGSTARHSIPGLWRLSAGLDGHGQWCFVE